MQFYRKWAKNVKETKKHNLNSHLSRFFKIATKNLWSRKKFKTNLLNHPINIIGLSLESYSTSFFRLNWISRSVLRFLKTSSKTPVAIEHKAETLHNPKHVKL